MMSAEGLAWQCGYDRVTAVQLDVATQVSGHMRCDGRGRHDAGVRREMMD